METEYLTSAASKSSLPLFDQPQVAVIGRSNCGKSTLVNRLLQRKNLARSGKSPGLTQMINFYGLNGKLVIGDLPGYGFSATGKSRRSDWQELVTAYLQSSGIQLALFLLDSRREPDTDDLFLLKFLAANHRVWVVLTKVDKIAKSAVPSTTQRFNQVLVSHHITVEKVFPVSSLNHENIIVLRDSLVKVVCGQ